MLLSTEPVLYLGYLTLIHLTFWMCHEHDSAFRTKFAKSVSGCCICFFLRNFDSASVLTVFFFFSVLKVGVRVGIQMVTGECYLLAVLQVEGEEKEGSDKEFAGVEEEAVDVEDTIAEQEKHEKVSYKSELKDLQEEGAFVCQ